MAANPFRPNAIVVPGMFAGRLDEIGLIDRGLEQTKSGNPWNFLLHGERGIGKSSLLLYANLWASRGHDPVAPPDDDEYRFCFVVLNVELDRLTDKAMLVQKIGRSLRQELERHDKLRSLLQEGWEFFKRWDLGGFSYTEKLSELLVEDLCETLVKADERLKSNIDGILILIDEADKGAAACDLGAFLKVTTERLTKRNCKRIAFGVSGLSQVLSCLKASHESSLRILNVLELKPLDFEERKGVVRKGLQVANRDAPQDKRITIEPDAEDYIARYSEGYPHFLQQYAYSAFETDNDGTISLKDVTHGMHKENGALAQLGARYFEEMYLDQIRSEDYRKVLRVMAQHPETWVKRQDIKKATGLADSTLGNALSAMKTKEIIIPQRGQRGVFRLATNSFGAWIRAQGSQDDSAGCAKQF